ncbi:M13 family metallopeptidase [Algibacillus agarilyticus]|uniref:M13 family metallopeptidase n=1 Tax=Algibacillus agarilyticus TaxID=2234133 RepID=UPI000DD09BDB|nr:M13-type metalloendopeptidase [Algibacillus agarilyticus]
MKPFLTALSSACFVIALGACSDRADPQDVPKPIKKIELQSGIDLANIDKRIRPQDDFYRHVNGKWLEKTQIPADKSNYGAFTELYEQSQQAMKTIIEKAAANTQAVKGSDEQKLGDFYNAYMNLSLTEAKGLQPLEQEFALVEKIGNKQALITALAELDKRATATPIGWYVNNDAKNSTTNALYILQSGIGLPDRDYYLKADEKFVNFRREYKTYIADLLRLIQHPSPETAAANILAFETQIAQAQWTRVDSRDANKRYNKMTPVELNQLMGADFDWSQFASHIGFDHADYIIVSQPSFFKALGELVSSQPLAVWQDYLRFHIIDSKAHLLNKTVVDRSFAFHSTVLSGVTEQKPRWKKAVDNANDIIGEIVGRLYVKDYFKPEAKIRMIELVDNLINAFELSIEQLDWMSAETKAAAKIKLAQFTPKIGYPDKWKDYSALEIEADDLVGNFVRYNLWLTQEYAGRIGKPVDRDEWFMTPQTVNAYFNPVNNEIVFPAAILQPPFFNLDAEDAVNYGGIGAVIGHEIGHGFDDQGAKYDGHGNLVNWWSDTDLAEFETRGSQLVKQYAAYKPFADANVNGELTLGENIGDLGGLTVALKAYQLSLAGKEGPLLDGYTSTQRFFLSWGQIWRRLYRDEELRRRLLTDSHSPSEYRVIGIVSNMPAFYQAFDVKQGDGMYIAPAERVKIW